MSHLGNKQTGGISFILRARNEQNYITEALSSLESINIPYQIIAILHSCTDRTKELVQKAAKHQPITIYETNLSLSRAGFENLITPASNPHSLTSFYNWCFSKGKYYFTCKFDADFRLSPALVAFINNELPIHKSPFDEPICYAISCMLSPAIVNTEIYMFNCLLEYRKHVFWELPYFFNSAKTITLSSEKVIWSIPPSILKPYWRQTPWFQTEDPVLCQKFKVLTDLLGEEQTGLARASNQACNELWPKLMSLSDQLKSHGIFMFE
jgi:glycosyltransferase involved in cell wall biosynthesis